MKMKKLGAYGAKFNPRPWVFTKTYWRLSTNFGKSVIPKSVGTPSGLGLDCLLSLVSVAPIALLAFAAAVAAPTRRANTNRPLSTSSKWLELTTMSQAILVTVPDSRMSRQVP